jgi:TatD DNase family protein
MGIVYRYKDALYANLTNRCPTACVFCIKNSWGMRFRGSDLRLGGREPEGTELAAEAEKSFREKVFSEFVFCGYGEPTYRLGALVEASRLARRRLAGVALRLNTVGLGDLVCGRPIASELQEALDEVRVSLNTADPAQWTRLMRPKPEFAAAGFQAVLSFTRECASRIPTTVTALERPDVDLAACRRLARSLGARFLERPYLAAYEDR